MSKEIQLHRIGRPGSNSFTGFEREKIPFNPDSIEEKNWLRIQAGENRTVSMLEKRVGDLRVPIFRGFGRNELNLRDLDNAEKLGLGWKIMKDRGVPVVESMRVVDKDHVVMTNLAVNGKGVYDPKGLRKNMTENPQVTDEVFKGLIKTREAAMRERAESIIELVNNQGVLLADDGLLHLIVGLDGGWEFIYCDISGTKIYKTAFMLSYAEKKKNIETVETELSLLKLF